MYNDSIFTTLHTRWYWPHGNARATSLQTIVRRFLCDNHIVNVRFLQPGGSDTQETSLLLEFLDVVAARVAHARAQTPHKLSDHILECPFVWHSSLDAFWYEFRFSFGQVLSISIPSAFTHCSN